MNRVSATQVVQESVVRRLSPIQRELEARRFAAALATIETLAPAIVVNRRTPWDAAIGAYTVGIGEGAEEPAFRPAWIVGDCLDPPIVLDECDDVAEAVANAAALALADLIREKCIE